MQAPETDLGWRRLRFDGVSIIEPKHAALALLQGLVPSQLRVSNIDREIQIFNEEVPKGDRLQLPEPGLALNFSWQLPEEFLNLDVYSFVAAAFEKLLPVLEKEYSKEQVSAAIDRIAIELVEFERRGMLNFLRTVIYILHEFRRNGVVWGVGRGSSCASYVLFLIGLHCVDPIKYSIPMEEFFHD